MFIILRKCLNNHILPTSTGYENPQSKHKHRLMPCLKVALTAVDKAFGNQVTIRLALPNLTRTETHHQYLNLLMWTIDSLPSADLKSLQTYLGPCPSVVSHNNFWPAVEVHTSLYQFWNPWHMNFIQITKLFKKLNPKDFVSRNQWRMYLNHKVGEGCRDGAVAGKLGKPQILPQHERREPMERVKSPEQEHGELVLLT